MGELIVEEVTLVLQESPHSLDLDQNPAAVYLAGLRPSGRRSMLQALNVMAEMLRPGAGATALTLPWHELGYQHTTALATALTERGYKPATVNKFLCALRGVLAAAETLELMSADDYRRAAKVKSVKVETLPRGRALAEGELTALMRVCGNDTRAIGARDAALIAVLYGAGLRRSEIVKLDLADYEPDRGALTIRGGKGGKDRLTYVGSTEALDDWLDVRGDEAGPLFCPVKKGRVGQPVAGQRLTEQAILYILKKRAKEAGVANFSPHDLRRTFVSDLLDAGADIATVQKLAGHAQVTTTARYDRRGEAAKHKAASLLHIPYQRRRLSVPMVEE